MEVKKDKVDNLKYNPNNLRIHSERQIEEMSRSIKKFGQFRPVVVDENNIVLAGNGLLAALVESGYKEVDIIKYDDLSNTQKDQLMIADNKIYELGKMDLEEMDKKLKNMFNEDSLDVPGFESELLREVFSSEMEEQNKNVNEQFQYGELNKESIEAIGKKDVGGNVDTDRKEKQSQESEEPEELAQQVKITNKEIEIDYDEKNNPMPYIKCKKCNNIIWL